MNEMTLEQAEKIAEDAHPVGLDMSYDATEHALKVIYNEYLKMKNPIVVGVKRLSEDAQIPKMQREGDAAFDIYSLQEVTLTQGTPVSIDCGVACEIPEGYKIMVNGRSGLAKKGIFCHVGTVDPNYKGMIGTILINLTPTPYQVHKGDRVGQISLSPIIPTQLVEVQELSPSVRGAQGFGSSGR